MAIEEREIGINDVKLGMFVCRLDRPWTDTQFPLQGFMVRDIDQISVLRDLCSRVWIDMHRSKFAIGGPPPRPMPVSELETSSWIDPALCTEKYVDTVRMEDERPAALLAIEAARRMAERIVNDVREGRVLAPEDVREAAVPIVASLLRNADALFWVNALRQRDGYAYSHAINCSALAAALGRHLGMPQELLVDLASGGLLLDIGKTRVPDEVIDHPGPLNPLAMGRARRHVELGVQVLEDAGEQNPVVLQMMRGHHERFDGSGYPNRIAGNKIPLFARMAAIIDSFDAMTSDRPYARAIPRHDALQELYRGRGSLYQSELVEQFISCLGVYPTGSMVELLTGELAVVMAQNPSRRLRPRILVLTGPDGRLRETFVPVDLMDPPMEAPDLAIRRPVVPSDHDIDLTELYL